ncbi:related to small s protein [Fusarium fujikuroi]|nr:related to small s protein [Fusarium fujikuroi]SCO15283.1 related to small s protein [Fusarium fujikuroi]SCV55005.1 related to small s protein [Fusarium fujikuroi]
MPNEAESSYPTASIGGILVSQQGTGSSNSQSGCVREHFPSDHHSCSQPYQKCPFAMDPVTVVGLASAIISFVPLGVKLLQSVREIRESVDGSVGKNQTRKAIVDEMQAVSRRLKSAVQTGVLPEQRGLYDLALKCHDLSQKILELLDKIRPKNISSFESYRSAYRAWSCESEIKNLEKQLNDCRSQLALGLVDISRYQTPQYSYTLELQDLTIVCSQESLGYSRKLLAMALEDASRLAELQRHIESLENGVQVDQMGTEAMIQLQRLLHLQNEALTIIYQNRILESIRFESMHERDDRVHYPHEHTFNWLVEEHRTENEATGLSKSDSLEMHNMKLMSRKLFMGWLSSPEGIFHVSGKLGSGKSTLMKLLCTHEQTRIGLEKWAGNKSLLITQFFFWKPGTELQKPLNSLYRSLLYDILQAHPKLTRDALPNVWKEVENSPWQIQTKLALTIDVAKSALERIIYNSDLCAPNICFCFFIDGLDEYDDSHSQDHLHLVNLLKHWVQNSQGRLKIVVSSRDYNVFLNGFSSEYRLQLHKLTWFDMRLYVRDSLYHLSDSNLRENLLTAIPKKASGIFLWTILVVNEIRKKIEDQISQDQLLQLLDSLPPGLEALFEHILSSLDKNSRRAAYQTMSLLRTAIDNHLTFALMEFSFLENYQRDSNFSTQEAFLSNYAREIDEVRIPEVYEKRLRGICGGLVECHQSTAKHYKGWGSLSFTHRSIPDMLGKANLKAEIQTYLEGFNSIDALSHLIFAVAQFKKNKSEARPSCAGVTWMRLAANIDEPPYSFLHCISSWLGDPSHVIPEPNYLLLHHGVQVFTNQGLQSLVRYGSITKRETFSTICQGALIGNVEYVEWEFKNSPKAIDKAWKRVLVANALLDTYLRDGLPISALSYFFKGAFLSQERPYFGVNHLLTNEQLEDAFADISHSSTGLSYALLEDLTVWERFLVSCFLGWIGMRYPFHTDRFGLAVAQFLLHGAPSEFRVVIGRLQRLRFPFYLMFHFPMPNSPLSVEIREDEGISNEVIERWVKYGSKPSMSMSLRKWIQIVSPKNKIAILEILDTAKERLPGSRDSDKGPRVSNRTTPLVTKLPVVVSPSPYRQMSLHRVFPG